jgi:hypothetical protein
MNENSRDLNHPVWDVYDLYRTAHLNVCYYSVKLNRFIWYNFLIEIILAITASSSAVAALWFWDHIVGEIVWKFLGVISALIAVSKPIIKLTEKIRKYEEVLMGYRSLEHDLYIISVLISQNKKYNEEHRTKFMEALGKSGKLIQQSPEVKIDEKLRVECRVKTESELPSKNFYIPKED